MSFKQKNFILNLIIDFYFTLGKVNYLQISIIYFRANIDTAIVQILMKNQKLLFLV